MEAGLRRGFGVVDLDRDGRGWERKRGTLKGGRGTGEERFHRQRQLCCCDGLVV